VEGHIQNAAGCDVKAKQIHIAWILLMMMMSWSMIATKIQEDKILTNTKLSTKVLQKKSR